MSITDLRTHRRAFVAAAAMSPLAPRSFRAQNATAVPDGTPGGTLRVGVQGDPAELDPALVILDAASLVIDMAYEGLVHADASLRPQPRLATSWTISDDGTIYTFTLRQGVTFHNGRPFVADDVVYSLNRVMDDTTASPWKDYASSIATIEAPDDATVVITLSRPDASFLSSLCRRGLSIVPREEVEANGDLKQTMVGTGPFTFVEYVPNSIVRFEKNPSYWEPNRPYVDALELLIIPGDTSRTTALLSGTVDLIEAVPQQDSATIAATDGFRLEGGPTTNLRWITFNLRRPPFDNIDFRRAVAMSLNRQQIIDNAVFGQGTPLLGLYPTSYWAGYPTAPGEADVDGATALLATVNLPDDFAPGLLTWGEYDFLSNTAVTVQEQLKQIGIEATLEPEENATYLERYFSGDFDIAVMGAGGYVDPADFLSQSLITDGTTNAAGYSDPEMDELLNAGIEAQDPAARAEIYVQIQDKIIADLPWIALYTSDTFEGMSDKVQGFGHYLTGGLTALKDTWLSEEPFPS